MRTTVKFDRVNFFEQAEAIERVLQAAVQEALAVHKKLGHRIVVWKDGKVVTVPPEEIEVLPEYLDSEECCAGVTRWLRRSGMFIDIRFGSRARAPEERNVSGEETATFRSDGARKILKVGRSINIRSRRDENLPGLTSSMKQVVDGCFIGNCHTRRALTRQHVLLSAHP
jgi:hypothetical protein